MTRAGTKLINAAKEALSIAQGASLPGMSVTFWIAAFPPSTNRLFANVAGRGRIKSETYRTWINASGWDMAQAHVPKVRGHFKLALTLCESKRRSNSDLDNRCKAVLDLLVKHGVVEDDSLADEILLVWGEALGGVRVRIEAAE